MGRCSWTCRLTTVARLLGEQLGWKQVKAESRSCFSASAAGCSRGWGGRRPRSCSAYPGTELAPSWCERAPGREVSARKPLLRPRAPPRPDSTRGANLNAQNFKGSLSHMTKTLMDSLFQSSPRKSIKKQKLWVHAFEIWTDKIRGS